MALGDYAEKLRGVYDELIGADERDTETVLGFGPDYDTALENAEENLDLKVDGEVETVDDYNGGTLDQSTLDSEIDPLITGDEPTSELTIAVLEYEVTEEPEPETTGTRTRGAGAPGDSRGTGSNGLSGLDYDQ